MGAVHKLYPTSDMTQCQKVVHHVEETGGITAWEAINQYGITRLAARVHELTGTGYALKAEDIGDGYVRYVPDHRKRLNAIRLDIEHLTTLGSHGELAQRLPQLVVDYNNTYRQTLRNGVL